MIDMLFYQDIRGPCSTINRSSDATPSDFIHEIIVTALRFPDELVIVRSALYALEKLDPVLYKEANRVEDPRKPTAKDLEALKTMKGAEKKAMEGRLPGLFPREFRIPTDTPPRSGWDYEWKAPSS